MNNEEVEPNVVSKKLGLNIRAALAKEFRTCVSLEDPTPEMINAHPNSIKCYVNDPASRVLITEDSIILYRAEDELWVRFDQLVDIEALAIEVHPTSWKRVLSTERESRVILLKLRFGKVVNVPVLNDWGDVLSMRSFMRRVLFFEKKRRRIRLWRLT